MTTAEKASRPEKEKRDKKEKKEKKEKKDKKDEKDKQEEHAREGEAAVKDKGKAKDYVPTTATDTTLQAQVSAMTGSTLIKLLKSPSTPEIGSKIAIAAAAWADVNLLIPRKADVIRDWIIEAWGRAKAGPLNPILTPEYHNLLVTVTPSCAAPAVAPLSLLSTYVDSCKASGGTHFDLAALPSAVTASLPLLFFETKAESWAEMWGTTVGGFAAVEAGSPAANALEPVADFVCGALALALPTSPNAKKIAASLHPSLPNYAKALAHGIHAFGNLTADLFFPFQTLQTVDPIKPLLSSLKPDTHALTLLPHLFECYVAAVLKHRYALYGKSNPDRPIDVIVADRVRAAVIGALGTCLAFANAAEDSGIDPSAVWGARLAMWETLIAWGGYLEEETGGALVATEGKRAAKALAVYGASEANAVDEGLAGKILRTLDALERLDHARADIDTVVIGWCLASPTRTHAAARALLTSVLLFHQLTHSLPTFIDLIADAATGLFDPALPSAALSAVYTLVASGPLSDKTFADSLAAAVKSVNLAGRRSAVWASLLDGLGGRVRTALSSEPVGGKRKRESMQHAPARLVSVLSRLATVILSAGIPAQSGDEEVEGATGAVARAFIPEIDEDKKEKKAHHDPSLELVLAARLRVARAASLVTGEPIAEVQVAVDATGGLPELGLEAFRYMVTHLAMTAHVEKFPAAVDSVIALLSGGSGGWSGRDANVSAATLPAACWTILAQNGLAVLDAVGDGPQLDRLAGILVSRQQAIPGLSVHSAITRILGCAETWELINVRSALLRALGTGSFGILSAAPIPWLSKGTRNALLATAYKDEDEASKPAIRAFLARLASGGILGPLDVEKLDALLASADGAEEETLALAAAAFPHLIRTSLPSLIESAIAALKSKDDVRIRAVPLLLQAICAVQIAKLSDDKAQLEKLEAAARKVFGKRAKAALDDMAAPGGTTALEALSVLSGFSRWLGIEQSCDAGPRLLSLVLAGKSDAGVTALQLLPRDSLLAGYLLLSARGSDAALDDAFKAHARSLTADEYGAELGALLPRTTSPQPTVVATALRATSILVSAAVEGSGKAIAGVLGQLLPAIDTAVHSFSLPCVEEGLRLIGALVDDRTGLLRPNDAAQLIATLGSILLPSDIPPAPAPHLFGLALSPLLTLCRHRGDLVLAHLPSVIFALSAAIPLLQVARGRAGRKHMAAKRPFWLSPTQSGDSELLSRVLVALCASRSDGTNIAGPLGKHAPAILVAYARACADPWGGLSAQHRTALQPGLFALCDVVTAGGRADGRGREGEGVGAAFGLERDDGEREVWADMWRAWGRKRYTGRG